MSQDTWLVEVYYDWLKSEAFSEVSERREYDGVLRVLHDIPFYWTIWSDSNRAGDAMTFRQSDFLGYQKDLDRLDQRWLNEWAQSTPSVLEVLLSMARRWSFYFEDSVPFYFAHMFLALKLDRYPGRSLRPETQQAVRQICDEWMSRQFQPNGDGSPFPIKHALQVVDFRQVDIWGQMNAYSAEHFQ
jgi:hypothetical protein